MVEFNYSFVTSGHELANNTFWTNYIYLMKSLRFAVTDSQEANYDTTYYPIPEANINRRPQRADVGHQGTGPAHLYTAKPSLRLLRGQDTKCDLNS